MIILNTKLPMLNKYGKFSYAIYTFQEVTSHQEHKNRNIGSQKFKYSKISTLIIIPTLMNHMLVISKVYSS